LFRRQFSNPLGGGNPVGWRHAETLSFFDESDDGGAAYPVMEAPITKTCAYRTTAMKINTFICKTKK
jgi:hypothetical protein